MSGVRIPPLPVEEADALADTHGVGPGQSSLNIYRLLLRRPRIAVAMRDLLNRLLFRCKLDDRLRELAIMRIGWMTGSQYEWTQHWSIAIEHFDLEPADLLDVRDWPASSRYSELDRGVLRAVDETLEGGRIGDETWSLLRSHLDDEACIDLTLCIGAWLMVSTFLRTMGVPLEEGVEPWPPDGKGPDEFPGHPKASDGS